MTAKITIIRSNNIIMEGQIKVNEDHYTGKDRANEVATQLMRADLFLIELAINTNLGLRCHISNVELDP